MDYSVDGTRCGQIKGDRDGERDESVAVVVEQITGFEDASDIAAVSAS